MASTSSSSTQDGVGAGKGAAVSCGGDRDLLADTKELLSLAAALPVVFRELRNREMSEERFTGESSGPHVKDSCPHVICTCSHSGQVPGTAPLTRLLSG